MRANGIPTIGLGPYIMNVRHTPLEPNASDAIVVTAEVLPRAYPADSVMLFYRAMYQSEGDGDAIETLVNSGSVWRYLDDGSNQGIPTDGISWFGHPDYNDSGWSSGPAELGYGDASEGRPEATVVNYGDPGNKYITTYFRHTFNVPPGEAANFIELTVSLLRDDGASVYLNGVEVVRSNLPGTLGDATILFNTQASAGISGSGEYTFYNFTVDSSLLNDGNNVLAVEIHQWLPTSSDINFDLKLLGEKEAAVSMYDDGAHSDGQPADGVYGAAIAPGLATPRQMLRYRIETTDVKGNENRAPLPLDLIGVKQWPEYFGTMIADPTITSELPILYWFTDDPAAAKTRSGTRASVCYNGEFYDNIFVRVRGSMGAGAFDPPPHKFIFNKCHKFRASDNLGRVGEFNLNVHGWDDAYVRQTLAFDTHHNAGVPASDSFLMLVLLNGGSERVAIFVEQPDEDFLERNGMDPDGALYKWVVPGPLYATLSDITVGTEVEKKTRLEEDWSDLEALVDGLNAPSEEARKRFVFDNLNVPEIINYLAVNVIHTNVDRIWKNFYMYRDSDGSGEWSILPWDMDFTYGIGVFLGGEYVEHPFFGDEAHPFPKGGHVCEAWNVLYDVIFNLPETREMYLRHLRTLMDELLQSPGTPVNELKFEQRVDELAAPVYPHVNIAGGISGLKGFFPARRNTLYETYGPSGSGLIPGAQHANPVIRFGAIEFSPASANQDHEYIELINTGDTAIDISGWTLTGGVEYAFQPGTVILSGGTLYVSPDVNAFRARLSSPTGGEGLFVQGNYSGHLSSWGETINLLDANNNLVDTLTYTGNPSDQQRYLRITEIMYHPAAGGGFNEEEYEYVELKNIGSASLLLDGVKLTDGIYYTFVPGDDLYLGPGEYLLLVKNRAAFASRYDTSGVNIAAGVYTGSLENCGETINLEDDANNTILEFDYDDDWYDITDGLGYSLTIKDPNNSDLESWDSKGAWRPSAYVGGSPGDDDPCVLPNPGAVVINELLAHSDVLYTYDWVELYNTTDEPINIGGWYLSDDGDNLKKYTIPDGTSIDPCGYYVFYEDLHFGLGNPADPCNVPFALSENGETLYLHSGQDGVLMTGYSEDEKFGPSQADVPFGRYYKASTDTYNFVAMSADTPNLPNAYPKVGPIVISEIMYHPQNNADAEYVELLNIDDSNVTLQEYDNELHIYVPWRFTDDGGITFDLPLGVTMEPAERILLVRDITAFNSEYIGVPGDVQIFQWVIGRLNNAGEKIQLSKPGDEVEATRYYIRVDRVNYSDGSHPEDCPGGVDLWPTGADGDGESLARKVSDDYGNDPDNWQAASPTPGSNPQIPPP